MLFNSLEYLLFFPIVVLSYFLLPHRFRWVLLLAASYFFYMCWNPVYIVLILLSTLIDYYASQKMGEKETKRERRKFLYLSLFSNLGLLFSFKYFNFFSANLSQLFEFLGLNYMIPVSALLLPMGISFYTFQTMSYSIDVYNGKIKPEKHLGIFALFVSFFPQLVAGPIERAGNLLAQFRIEHKFEYKRVTSGLKLIVWGLFKKVVIADRLAGMVDYVYNDPTNFGGFSLILASLFFAFQIYCDFSGYSDIAIGSAKVLGFKLMDNFKRPYFSKSIGEFWKRWHISLSTWFRDYVYIPMGGNRVVKWRWFYNLFITFLVSGLWHGANWTFIIWGALHGGYLVTSNLLNAEKKNKSGEQSSISKWGSIKNVFQIVTTFVLVVFAWIFFRANNLSDATYIVSHLFSNIPADLLAIAQNLTVNGTSARAEFLYLGASPVTFVLAVGFILLMESIQIIQERKGSVRELISAMPIYIRWSIYISSIYLIILFGMFNKSEFIYFQF